MGQTSSINSKNKEIDEQNDPDLPTRLYSSCPKSGWPLIYCPEYNLSLMGLEKFSKFDVTKCRRVCTMLVQKKIVTMDSFVTPPEPTEKELKLVHSEEYITSLKRGRTVSEITGISGIGIMPNSFLNSSILRPFRLQAAGTIMAGKLAVENGWAINLGGGQHHCSAGRSTPGGFSVYADITLNIKYLWNNFPSIQKVMIIDLDVHQGNGYARDFLGEEKVYIFDIYNGTIFPQDEEAKRAIKCSVELKSGTEDEEYLTCLRDNMDSVLDEFEPQYVLYNAGVDILQGDALGELKITPDGVIERDRIVFSAVRKRNIPIAMVLSGGFAKTAAQVVSDSIANLHSLGLIEGPKT